MANFKEKLEKLKKLVNKNIPDAQKHFFNGKMISTKERIKSLIYEISRMNLKNDKFKLQNLLRNLEGAINIALGDSGYEIFKIIWKLFEEINPLWKFIYNLQIKNENKNKISNDEWVYVAKISLESMLKGEIEIDFLAGVITNLLFLYEFSVEKSIEKIYLGIEGLINPFSKESSNIKNEETRKKVEKLLVKTEKLIKYNITEKRVLPKYGS
jgi:hypothetical protein